MGVGSLLLSSLPLAFDPRTRTTTLSSPITQGRGSRRPTPIAITASTSRMAASAASAQSSVEEDAGNDAVLAGKAVRGVPENLLNEMVSDALVWSALHGLVVGDRNNKRSGTVPGVGLVHAPFALLPMLFPKSKWRQACELAPIFNELVDRVSLDGNFLQDALSRTKKVDAFTSRLLDIHAKLMKTGKKEDIRLGLHRSDYMLDAATSLLYQIELNTISSSFPGLSCLVSELHRSLLSQYGKQFELENKRVPGNTAVSRFADALAKAYYEYNDPSAVVMVVVQTEERNMYDQHWLSAVLREIYPCIILALNFLIVWHWQYHSNSSDF